MIMTLLDLSQGHNDVCLSSVPFSSDHSWVMSSFRSSFSSFSLEDPSCLIYVHDFYFFFFFCS